MIPQEQYKGNILASIFLQPLHLLHIFVTDFLNSDWNSFVWLLKYIGLLSYIDECAEAQGVWVQWSVVSGHKGNQWLGPVCTVVCM